MNYIVFSGEGRGGDSIDGIKKHGDGKLLNPPHDVSEIQSYISSEMKKEKRKKKKKKKTSTYRLIKLHAFKSQRVGLVFPKVSRYS